MPLCPNCAHEVGDRDRVCVHCGTHLADGSRPGPGQPRAQAPRPQAPPPHQPARRPGPGPGLIIGALVLLALVGGAMWFVLHEEKEEAQPVAETPVPELPTELPRDMDELQRMAESGLTAIFGDDEEVGEVSLRRTVSSGLSEAERASAYSYQETDCTTLLSDVFQQGALGIAREVARVTAFSDETENRMGDDYAREIAREFGQRLDNPRDERLIRYVRELGAMLTQSAQRPGITYTFHVIQDDSFNAFAIPGGHIYIFTGLLNQVENEAQLAGVIAHEIAHVDLRHCIAAQQVLARLPESQQNETSFIAAQMIAHPFQGRVESEADRQGLTTVYEAGYSPYQVVRLWEDMAEEGGGHSGKQTDGDLYDQAMQEGENIMNDHPTARRRACQLKNITLRLQQAAPRDYVYVGQWNLRNTTPFYTQPR